MTAQAPTSMPSCDIIGQVSGASFSRPAFRVLRLDPLDTLRR
jgi:hypothetical protein